jgi:SOS-response transcriptional repressor LexA
MAVSRWERGEQEPSAQAYIRIGNLARDSSCWYFWERAGLHSENVLRVLPNLEKNTRHSKLQGFEIVTAGISRKKLHEKIELVAVPVLQVAAASHQEQGDVLQSLSEAPIESMLAAPKDWCPNPAHTSCLRVRGNSMAPLIQDGYLVAVDSSATNMNDLNGKIVIAWHRDVGLTISRLRLYDHTAVLVPENSEFVGVTIGAKQPWKIVGTVLWWIGRAP